MGTAPQAPREAPVAIPHRWAPALPRAQRIGRHACPGRHASPPSAPRGPACRCRAHSEARSAPPSSDAAAAAAQEQPQAQWRDVRKRVDEPPKIRCALCYEPMHNLAELAGHLVGKRHTDLFPRRDSAAACPYCGAQLTRQQLFEHVRGGACPCAGAVAVPPAERRTLSQAQLDADPRFAVLVEERVPDGTVRVRPMHRQHTFEAALVVTEAFTVDLDPPRFDWMLSELRRHAAQFLADPGPVTRQAVDFAREPLLQPPCVADVVRQAPPPGGELFGGGGGGAAEARELRRRQTEAAWGVWVWLVAELVPDDPAGLPPGQDSTVIGATALMFHDRAASLERMQLCSPPISPAALDYSLWLDPRPPAELPHERCAFVWWTSVDTAHRRKGVAGLLLRGCEALGAAAGFWSFYLQAALRQRDRSSLLGAWLPRAYNSALNCYRKAGYTERQPAEQLGALFPRGQSVRPGTAALMHKQF